MLSIKLQKMIEKATVTLTGLGGRGVLIPGDFILTAAHCVVYDLKGGMILGDHYLQEALTSQGEKLTLEPYAIDPCSDIAVLGQPDNQVFYDEADDFDKFCENTKPIRLSYDEHEHLNEFPVYLQNHTGKWINAVARQGFKGDKTIWMKGEEYIGGGSSGSPIVNEVGELVGVVSNAEESHYDGIAPRPHMALPVWAVNQIREAS